MKDVSTAVTVSGMMSIAGK